MSPPSDPEKEITRKPLPAYTTAPNAHNWEPLEEEDSTKTPRRGFVGAATTWALSDRFNRILPPHKRYLGRSRRTLLIAIGVIFVLLLALIIGLAVGLKKKSGSSKSLPLPTGADTYEGDLTYYDPGLGACGVDSGDSDYIVAISHYTFDAAQTGSNPNENPLCNRKIRATRVNELTGKKVSVDLTVIDRCTGCEPTDIDVAPEIFKKLADPTLGRVLVTWAWL
ncbi:hypothetical protein P154DRAFT_244743 [Amniculicola lignicola CBS 123094]|uniref:RlpA-like protein double-psi beta-barrel domain-containing protein n=1 Tax=Amniculicola lignicola CBS 123094 TaxID=1392246 RepID=A0A6A5WA89_9PLEO|nr:hypothetical protein P154DRAFT_244743 [Amniculicola lignicola CBS 123094]